MFAVSFFKTQQTVPLSTFIEDIPANAYVKDVNNELIPYTGTWNGTWNNKTFTVQFKRIKKYLDHRENNSDVADLQSVTSS